MSLAHSARAHNCIQRHSTESRLRQLEAESLQDSLPEGFSGSALHPSHLVRRLYYPHAVVTAHLVLGSVLGVLARKGLQELTTYPGSFLGGVVWANFVACLVMGFSVESLALWAQLLDQGGKLPGAYSAKASIPAYVGITTGFCGSCSSFSSFILEMFTKAANLPLPGSGAALAYPNTGYGVLATLEVALAHIGLSVFGLAMGKHLVRAVDKRCPAISPRVYKKAELAMSMLGTLGFIAVLVLVGVKDAGTWRSWTFSCMFAPFGTMSRYWLSRHLNPLKPNFPCGTFAANIGACILLGVFNVLVRGRAAAGSSTPVVSDVLSCHVLVGLDDGYCGCLSTVSTFAVELAALDLVHSYTYGLVSISTGFACMLLIAGSYNWTLGFTSQVC